MADGVVVKPFYTINRNDDAFGDLRRGKKKLLSSDRYRDGNVIVVEISVHHQSDVIFTL